jgi:hypothetical protein
MHATYMYLSSDVETLTVSIIFDIMCVCVTSFLMKKVMGTLQPFNTLILTPTIAAGM